MHLSSNCDCVEVSGRRPVKKCVARRSVNQTKQEMTVTGANRCQYNEAEACGTGFFHHSTPKGLLHAKTPTRGSIWVPL